MNKTMQVKEKMALTNINMASVATSLDMISGHHNVFCAVKYWLLST